MKEKIIGVDEIGKIEPFKQLVSVAVYKDPAVDNTLKTGDSKALSLSKKLELGENLTEFTNFDEIENRVYINEKYGLVYAIRILSNEEYNSWKEKKINANAVLSYIHNETIKMVYDKVKELGKDIDKIVVDDFIHQGDNEERVKRFGKYLECFDDTTVRVNEIHDVEMIMEEKSEDKFPETVGAASDIGIYIDQLWQKKVIDQFQQIDIDFSQNECFGNGGKIKDLMEQIIQKCGDLDASPITMKHTSYYENAKK